MEDWRPYARQLITQLSAARAIRDPAWRAAFETTPRHLFVPRFYGPDKHNQPRHPVDGHAPDPRQQQHWIKEVYRDVPLVTAFQAVGAGTPPLHVATSSCSAPSLVAAMLDRLRVNPGNRVLEIGTGTGWTAALLAARLGGGKLVTSVEVDPQVSARAARHLLAAGRNPLLVVGDGAAGYAPRAPYDRIIATCAVTTVPAAWVEQLAPGGLLVTPSTLDGGPLLVLRKDPDGRLRGVVDAQQAWFMPLRGEGRAPSPVIASATGKRQTGETAVPPPVWAHPGWRVWLGVRRPGLQSAVRNGKGKAVEQVTVHTDTDRATVDYAGNSQPWPVSQGPQRLWSAVEAAWWSWTDKGRPGRESLRVEADGRDVTVRLAGSTQPVGVVTGP